MEDSQWIDQDDIAKPTLDTSQPEFEKPTTPSNESDGEEEEEEEEEFEAPSGMNVDENDPKPLSHRINHLQAPSTKIVHATQDETPMIIEEEIHENGKAEVEVVEEEKEKPQEEDVVKQVNEVHLNKLKRKSKEKSKEKVKKPKKHKRDKEARFDLLEKRLDVMEKTSQASVKHMNKTNEQLEKLMGLMTQLCHKMIDGPMRVAASTSASSVPAIQHDVPISHLTVSKEQLVALMATIFKFGFCSKTVWLEASKVKEVKTNQPPRVGHQTLEVVISARLLFVLASKFCSGASNVFGLKTFKRKITVKVASEWFLAMFGETLDENHTLVKIPVPRFLECCVAVAKSAAKEVNVVFTRLDKISNMFNMFHKIQGETSMEGTDAYKKRQLKAVTISSFDYVDPKIIALLRSTRIEEYSPECGFRNFIFGQKVVPMKLANIQQDGEKITLTAFWGINISVDDDDKVEEAEEGGDETNSDEEE